MRIAIVTTHPPGKGSLNEYAYHFIRLLRQKPEASEIILLVDELPDGERYGDFTQIPDPSLAETSPPPRLAPVTVKVCWRFGSWNSLFRIAQAVRETKPDIVLFNLQFATFGQRKTTSALGLLSPALIKLVGYPTVVLLHNIMETVDLNSAGFASNKVLEYLIRGIGSIFTRILLTADLVALTIPKYVEILTTKYRAQNVLLTPHGSFDETAPEPNFALPPGPIQIMTFGKFGTYKKIETLIEAFERLKGANQRDLKLVIAGSDSPNTPGYLESVQKKYAEVTGIHFTGYVAEEDVPKIFGDAAAVVFPYTSTTGSSGVLHQAGDYAKAVVLPNLGDFAELIQEEGYTGEFFEPNDVESMATAIARIIDNPQNRKEIGMQNYVASQSIPIGEVVDWYLLHFESLLQSKHQANSNSPTSVQNHPATNNQLRG
ncbi:MAG: glycosyltransferase [Chloroflexota bacterium]